MSNMLLYFIGGFCAIGLMYFLFFNVLIASEDAELREETQE